MRKGVANDQRLIAFIDRLKNCATSEEAWVIFDREMKDNGIEHVLYGFASRNMEHMDEELLFHSHRKDFFEDYGTQGVETDWATLHCMASVDTVLWNTPEVWAGLTEGQKVIEEYAFDFNIAEGFTVSLRGGSPYGWGGVGLSATDMKKEEWYKLYGDRGEYLTAVVQAFHEFVMLQGYFNPYHLTKREKEVLKLIVDGYTRQQIAGRLGVGNKTIEVHTYAIRKKLHCANDVQVAVKALTFNLIEI